MERFLRHLAARAQDGDADSRLMLVAQLRRQGRPRDALHYATTADAPSPELLFLRGRCRLDLGENVREGVNEIRLAARRRHVLAMLFLAEIEDREKWLCLVCKANWKSAHGEHAEKRRRLMDDDLKEERQWARLKCADERPGGVDAWLQQKKR